MYGYGMMGGFGGGAGAGCTTGGAAGIRWIYALLILIVIVLQFGRRFKDQAAIVRDPCCDGSAESTTACGRSGGFLGLGDHQLIDNSVLFIIVVFLLILCAGCWGGGHGGAAAGYGVGGFGGGYGYY